MPMQSTTPTSPPPAPEPKKRPWWQKVLLGFAAMCVALVVAGGLVLGYALVVALSLIHI